MLLIPWPIRILGPAHHEMEPAYDLEDADDTASRAEWCLGPEDLETGYDSC